MQYDIVSYCCYYYNYYYENNNNINNNNNNNKDDDIKKQKIRAQREAQRVSWVMGNNNILK